MRTIIDSTFYRIVRVAPTPWPRDENGRPTTSLPAPPRTFDLHRGCASAPASGLEKPRMKRMTHDILDPLPVSTITHRAFAHTTVHFDAREAPSAR